MFQAEEYMGSMVQALRETFGDRLLYVGLQGSYLRGEATESSDLDVVVILENLSSRDLAAYKAVVESHPEPEKACGFLCGRQELAGWNPMEICGFLHGTKDYYGTIADYVPAFTRTDVVNFVKLSAGNLYHEICHRYVHADEEKNRRNLPGSFKQVFFILQSLYYLRDGAFYLTKKELSAHLTGADRAVMELAEVLRCTPDYDFDEAVQLLLGWCQGVLAEV